MTIPAQEIHHPDRELADRVRRHGDEQAFRMLYRRHTPRLYQLVLRLLGHAEQDAEDVVQETWLQAVERLGEFRWESAFGTWLAAIGLNRARDHLRKGLRRPTVPLPETLPARSEGRGDWVDLERAIARLPEGYRTVLVLHDVEGLTHEEIGAALGVTAGTSKSQLFAARRAMRGLLAPAGGHYA